MKQPNRSALDQLPPLANDQKAIYARYLVATKDVDHGACSAIANGLGYGVGQIATYEGTKLISCASMFGLDDSPSQILRTGIVSSEWSFVDIAVDHEELDLRELGFSGLLSLLAGDVFGTPYIKYGLVLEDFSIPFSQLNECSFPGPRYGKAAVMQKCGHSDGEFLVGLLLKPDFGVSPQHYADVAEAAIQGGIDYIKEDELTLDSSKCPRFRRVEAIADRILSGGRSVLYAANTTSKPQTVFETACTLVNSGASVLLINGLQTGLDIVTQLATSDKIGVPLHLHRAGYDIMSSGSRALSVNCLTKLFRLCGADIVHVGTLLGRLFPKDVVFSNIASLTMPLGHVAKSLPVLSRSSQETILRVTNDEPILGGLLLFDAEVYSSPLGIERGIRAICKLLESSISDSGR